MPGVKTLTVLRSLGWREFDRIRETRHVPAWQERVGKPQQLFVFRSVLGMILRVIENKRVKNVWGQ
jgi:hypothetical protein